MLLSVIIPSFNRCKTLQECLVALENQDLPKDRFEVIVVDDGSVDDTENVVKSFKNTLNITYYRQNNSGQGVARNLGISKAKGEIILFIGDDIIVKENFLTQHLRMHLQHSQENEAVLGFTDWHPKLTITPFMRWLTNGSSILGKFGGHQFAYEKLIDKDQADYNFFYTSNISLKKKLLERGKFDPKFSGYGWEDIELGYRLFKEYGLKIFYNKDAIGYHDHAMSEEGLKKRMYEVGAAAWIINDKYPELRKVPTMAKRIAFMIISNPISLFFLGMVRALTQGRVTNMYFYALSKKYFLLGLNSNKTFNHNKS